MVQVKDPLLLVEKNSLRSGSSKLSVIIRVILNHMSDATT